MQEHTEQKNSKYGHFLKSNRDFVISESISDWTGNTMLSSEELPGGQILSIIWSVFSTIQNEYAD